jgi:hypothetical protein
MLALAVVCVRGTGRGLCPACSGRTLWVKDSLGTPDSILNDHAGRETAFERDRWRRFFSGLPIFIWRPSWGTRLASPLL